MSRGCIILCHFCRCGCGCGVRGDLEIRYRSVLVDLGRSHDATHNFLWSHSRRSRARSASSFVPLAYFKLQLRLQVPMGELSRGVRGVVFVFDLLLNSKFVFSLLDTFDHCPLGQCPSLGLRLGPVCGRLPGVSLGPSSDPLLAPPFKSDPFLIDSLTQDGYFWASRSRPALF